MLNLNRNVSENKSQTKQANNFDPRSLKCSFYWAAAAAATTTTATTVEAMDMIVARQTCPTHILATVAYTKIHVHSPDGSKDQGMPYLVMLKNPGK